MTKQIKHQENKPVIESMINTAAIGLTAYGTIQITTGHPIGIIYVLFGVGLETYKYWGRNKGYW
tara:strand:+ start:8648 stop:8839 length:192 start_codon:yes stop_codon:yes gene_type:complete